MFDDIELNGGNW